MRAKRLVQSYLVIGLGSLMIGLWLSACETPATPTPTEPIMQASKTINPILPTAQLDNSIGHSDPTSAALAGEGEPSQPAQTPTPLPTLDVLPLQAVADDGTVLQFVFYAGRSTQAPILILLHDAGKNGAEWTNFAMPLHELGYNVFVPDQRGYGDSGGSVDWTMAVADVQALVNSLVRLGLVLPNSMALIGAGTGANLAIAACAQIATCVTTIAISPQDGTNNIDINTSIAGFGGRSLLIVSADDDEIGKTVAKQVNNQFSGDHFWQSYTSGGRGTDLLISQPDLPQKIVEWLQTRLIIP